MRLPVHWSLSLCTFTYRLLSISLYVFLYIGLYLSVRLPVDCSPSLCMFACTLVSISLYVYLYIERRLFVDAVPSYRDLTVIAIDVKGGCVQPDVVLHPYAVYVPGTHLISTTFNRLITVSVPPAGILCKSIIFSQHR